MYMNNFDYVIICGKWSQPFKYTAMPDTVDVEIALPSTEQRFQKLPLKAGSRSEHSVILKCRFTYCHELCLSAF